MNSSLNTVLRPAGRRLPLRFLIGVLGTLALALAFFYLLMRPSLFEMQAMTLFLAITAGVSAIAGYAAYRLGWLHRPRRISWALLGGYALASVLTFLNVWMTARLMFASEHDLLLATVLLVFAGGIAMSLGYFLSTALSDGILALTAGARALARGDLAVRVPAQGENELAELARTFNEMAGQLQAAALKQRQLDAMRRNLVAWAGHDLRTPVASIQAMVEALADGMVEDETTRQRYFRTMQRDIQSLTHLIDDLFDLAHFDAGGLELERHPAALADLISDTIERFAELAARGRVTLVGQATVERPVVVDTPQIERVLSNLVGNALRHTPPGGQVSLRAYENGKSVRVDVADSGSGVQAEDLPYIFDQFYRGEKSRSRATGGSGLGLAIARRIVEAHGGEIGVENNVEGGALFYFTLPLE